MTPLLLIVDDDALKARVVARIAERVGWRCQHATTLACALVHIEHGRFAAAVLDDDMHGYPRGEQMRGACTRVGLPAVIYSGTEGPNRILSTDLDALRAWLTEMHAAVTAPGAA